MQRFHYKDPWHVASLATALMALVPLIALIWLALQAEVPVWRHLVGTLFISQAHTTIVLTSCVAALCGGHRHAERVVCDLLPLSLRRPLSWALVAAAGHTDLSDGLCLWRRAGPCRPALQAFLWRAYEADSGLARFSLPARRHYFIEPGALSLCLSVGPRRAFSFNNRPGWIEAGHACLARRPLGVSCVSPCR